jgi:hypothetical protein
MNRFAEEANYWQTTVHPAVSQGEITEMLEQFGADAVMVMQGQAQGRYAWMIRFQWRGRSYRFTFMPLTCRNPMKSYTIGGKKRIAEDQARYQMGRIAVNFVKAILTAAETNPDAIFGFLELPAVAGRNVPPTTAELDVKGLTGALPDMNFLLRSGAEDNEA